MAAGPRDNIGTTGAHTTRVRCSDGDYSTLIMGFVSHAFDVTK